MEKTELETKLDRKESASWVPACNGQELPFTKGDYKYLYMFNTFTRKHALYCISNDTFLSDSEYLKLMGV